MNPHASRRHPLKMVCLPISPLPRLKTVYYQLLAGYPAWCSGAVYPFLSLPFAPPWAESFRFAEPPDGQRSMDSVRLRRDGTRRRFDDVIVLRCVLQCERVPYTPRPRSKMCAADNEARRRGWVLILVRSVPRHPWERESKSPESSVAEPVPALLLGEEKGREVQF